MRWRQPLHIPRGWKFSSARNTIAELRLVTQSWAHSSAALTSRYTSHAAETRPGRETGKRTPSLPLGNQQTAFFYSVRPSFLCASRPSSLSLDFLLLCLWTSFFPELLCCFTLVILPRFLFFCFSSLCFFSVFLLCFSSLFSHVSSVCSLLCCFSKGFPHCFVSFSFVFPLFVCSFVCVSVFLLPLCFQLCCCLQSSSHACHVVCHSRHSLCFGSSS